MSKEQPMGVALFFPPVSELGGRGEEGTPLGLLAAASFLDRAGYPVRIISRTYHGDPLAELTKALDRSFLVGISTMTGYQLKGAIAASKLVKALRPEIPVVWGGWHPSLCPDQVITQPFVDFVIRGQGEEALFELVREIRSGNPQFERIPGLHWKRDDGEAQANSSRRLTCEESWPDLPYHLVDLEKSLRKTEFGDRVLDVISSYGCPYECGFCAERAFSARRWKAMSAEKVFRQIKALKERYELDGVVFRDNNFFVDKNRSLRIAELLGSLPKPFAWGQVNGRTNILVKWSAAEWELLRSSGLKSILIGAESGYPESLDLIRKGATVAQTIELADMAEKHGISLWFSLFAGLPWLPDTGPPSIAYARAKNREDFQATIALLRKIVKRRAEHRYLYFRFSPYPGTDLLERAVKLGFRFPENLDAWAAYSLDNRNTEFLDRDIEEKIEVLQSYILPLLSGTKLTIAGRQGNLLYRSLARGVVSFFMSLAWLRWRQGWFGKSWDMAGYRLLRRLW